MKKRPVSEPLLETGKSLLSSESVGKARGRVNGCVGVRDGTNGQEVYDIIKAYGKKCVGRKGNLNG